MPVNKSSLRVYLMRRSHSKVVIYQKCVIFYKYCKELLVKRLLVKKLLSILHRLQIKQINVEDYIFKNTSICLSYQSQLKAYYILLHPKKPWNLLKSWLAQKVHDRLYPIFLFCSIITTQLLSTSLKSELQFWPVSELGIFHTLVLDFKDWLFDIIVTRHFRPKSVHLNESIYCKPSDRTLKMLLIGESHSFLRPIIPGLWKVLVLG